jgi:SAM-dependent methyltransferase
MRLLPKTYFPHHTDNRMESEGNLLRARADFLAMRQNNLRFLLRNRYKWMNRFIKLGDTIVEIGSGAGFSHEFIKGNVITTEIEPYPWVAICLDAMRLPFGPQTIDVVICVNALHHFANPVRVLHDLHGCLKLGGFLLLFEPNPSVLFLLLLRIMRHEGWSFEVDVFDRTASVNDPADPWSGNNAISYLMFRDRTVFRKNAPGYEIVHDSFRECMLFPLSGGVTAKTRAIELPIPVLKIIDQIDRKLCRLMPMVFAMGRAVVLQKSSI